MDMVQDFLDSAANMGAAAGAVHILKDTFVGQGAIVLEGRGGRRDACECCLIDPAGSPTDPKNRMCTTKGAIGTLTNQEERELCDPAQTRISRDGRCQRARDIRSAAQSCRQEFPDDNRRFFECFAPAFSKTTSRSS
mgnify:CR=1 FL=1